MRAAVLCDFGDLRVEEVPDPRPGPDDVVIEVACVQASVTECMLIAGDRVALHGNLAARLKAGPVQFGGHEFCGVVREVGSAVAGVQPGDRVTAVETVVCQECGPCRQGRDCAAPEYLGFTRPGALAERIVVPARNVVPVPAGISTSAAAAVQPLVGAIHAHTAARVQPGDHVLILGAGVMGLLAVQVARHGGADRIGITGRSPAKLALASQFGAACKPNSQHSGAAVVTDPLDGDWDVVIETAGGSPSAGLAGTSTLDLAVRSVRRGGRVVVVSVLPERAEVPLGLMRERAVTLVHPPSGGRSTFEYALRLVARGDVDLESMVTHRLAGVDEIPQAVAITRDKAAYGAINPAQVEMPCPF